MVWRNVKVFQDDSGEEKDAISDFYTQKVITSSQPRADPPYINGAFPLVFRALFWHFFCVSRLLCCCCCCWKILLLWGALQSPGLIPGDLTLNCAESCMGLGRVQEEREAFLGKEMPPKQPPHKPATCRKILHGSLVFKGLKNDCSFLWWLQWEPQGVTFEEILFTAAPGWEPCVSWAELCSLPCL